MTSLHELRAIEQQRIADERAAVVRAREAEAAAATAAEQARLEAEAAREQAERDERVRIEEARLAAEREARLRLEAADAAERARLAAQLEHDRLAQEMELRRAEVARKRPTWMVAVTGIALAAGLGLAWFAVDRMHQAADAQAAKDRAVEEKRQARADAAAAVARLDAMQRNLDDLEGAVKNAQHAVDVATSEAERKHAQKLLDDANHKAKVAHDAYVKAQRDQIIKVDDCGKHDVICR